MRALLVALAACGHPVPVAPSASASESKLVAPNTATLVTRVEATYAGMSTYADRGEVVERSGANVARMTFETAFRRAGGFRFEARDGGKADQAYLMWSADNKDVVVHWAPSPSADKLALDLASASESVPARVVMRVLVSLVVTELFRADTSGWLNRPVFGTPFADTVAHHRCWHLTTTDPLARMDVWIDQQSYLLRQFHVSTPAGADVTATYEPTADAVLADAQLAPPDLTGVKLTVHERAVWIGVLMQQRGNRVTDVFDHSPAANAGIQVGDDIVSVDGTEIATLGELRKQVARFAMGTRVPFEIRRNGAVLTVQVEIATRPDLDRLAEMQLVGHPAPDFTLPALDGNPVALAALAGKPVILDFWATWCGPCAMTAPMLAALHAKHPEVAMLGISDEDEAALRAHLAAHPNPYPIARDADAKIGRAYLVSGIPMVVLIDKAGIVRFIGVGVDGVARLDGELARLP